MGVADHNEFIQAKPVPGFSPAERVEVERAAHALCSSSRSVQRRGLWLFGCYGKVVPFPGIGSTFVSVSGSSSGRALPASPFIVRVLLPWIGCGTTPSPGLLQLLFSPLRLDEPLLDLAIRGLGVVPSRPLPTLAGLLAAVSITRVFGQDPPPLRRHRGPVPTMISVSKLRSFLTFSPLPRFTRSSSGSMLEPLPLQGTLASTPRRRENRVSKGNPFGGCPSGRREG